MVQGPCNHGCMVAAPGTPLPEYCGTPNMLTAGRIFANPRTPNEVWVNFGFNTVGFQHYPAYDPRVFAGHVSQEEYDDSIGAIKAVLDEKALDPQLTCCSMHICGFVLPTACASVFAVAYCANEINTKLDEAVATSVAKWRTKMSVRLEGLFKPSVAGGNWYDTE